MKKKNLLIFILVIISLITLTQAADLGPSNKYCTHMDYEIEYLGEKGVDGAVYCIFDEENKCKFDEFWNGSCGQEFVKEIPCRKEGEIVVKESYQLYGGKTSLYEQCCEGLVASGKPYVSSTGDSLYCYKPSKLKTEKFFGFFTSISGFILIGILLIFLIIFFLRRKFKKARE